MAERSGRRIAPWLAFLLGGLAASAIIVAISLYHMPKPAAPKLFALDLRLPDAPQTPTLPPPPIPVPK
jgi:hypothetical protein